MPSTFLLVFVTVIGDISFSRDSTMFSYSRGMLFSVTSRCRARTDFRQLQPSTMHYSYSSSSLAPSPRRSEPSTSQRTLCRSHLIATIRFHYGTRQHNKTARTAFWYTSVVQHFVGAVRVLILLPFTRIRLTVTVSVTVAAPHSFLLKTDEPRTVRIVTVTNCKLFALPSLYAQSALYPNITNVHEVLHSVLYWTLSKTL